MSQRNSAIEYIRGIAMLGVIGIHTGAYSLSNPEVNIHLFALLEIFTRFSVPIFFFASAFGLFFKQNLDEPFNYGSYFKRRCRTVVIPYMVWSLIYMLRESWLSGNYGLWSPANIFEYFFFGLASYHLYFLVILIWFYALMPLWRAILPSLLKHPLRNLAVLLCLQIAFNYYSSYMIHFTANDYWLNLAIKHRLNYLPLHYFFIFLLGAVCALRLPDFLLFIGRFRRFIPLFFAGTLAGILGAYYWLLISENYSPVETVFTVHQLNPIGVLYTLAATLFLMALFTDHKPSGLTASLLANLSRYSYPIYLVHPLVMYFLADFIAGLQLALTVPVIIFFYCSTVTISLGFGIVLEKAARFVPLLGQLLSGTNPVPKDRKASISA